MDLQLRSKTAFISGSTQGIGFSIARLLLIEGARVIINGRTQEKNSLELICQKNKLISQNKV